MIDVFHTDPHTHIVCAKSWQFYEETKNLCILTISLFFFIIPTFDVILGLIFALFLARNFKTNFLPKQKKIFFLNFCAHCNKTHKEYKFDIKKNIYFLFL